MAYIMRVSRKEAEKVRLMLSFKDDAKHRKEKPPGARVAVTLRLPRALYAELKREAQAVGCTLHEHILFQLAKRKKILT